MLFNEGGVAGHLQHLYDDPDLSFSEIKDIFIKAAQGELEGTEKTDGQNLFLSYNLQTQTPVAARNKGNIKNGGLTAQELAQKFGGRGTLETTFNDAFTSWTELVLSLPDELQVQIFGPQANVWYNAEIQDPASANVINYDQRNLVIHKAGHGEFDPKTGNLSPANVTKQAELLARAIEQQEKQDAPEKFKVMNNVVRRLKALSDERVLNRTLARLDREMSRVGVSDNQTIAEYVALRLESVLERQVPSLDADGRDAVLRRLYGEKNINLNQHLKALEPEDKEKIQLMLKYSILPQLVRPIENIVHDFAVEMLRTLESAFILDNNKEVSRLRAEVSSAIEAIQASENEDAMKILRRQLEKLKAVENICTPCEGFVFSYNGKNYKFTGNFAPVNQLLGLFKYGRGKVPPMKKVITERQSDRSIALFPGGFKPPHAGHYSIAKALAARPEINTVRVLISPKERDDITAEESLLVWELFTENDPKIQPEVSSNASPVGSIYDFMEQQTKPGDQVWLAVGEKDKESGRFKAVERFIQEKDLGISFDTMVAPNTMRGKVAMSATGLRDAIKEGNEEMFLKFMPEHLSLEDVKEIWELFSEPLNEMSAMGASTVAGYAGPMKTDKKNYEINEQQLERLMIDRTQILDEIKLRKEIRKILENYHVNKFIKEEKEQFELRKFVRSIIKEAQSDIAENPHETTGINVLADLLKKIIPQIETGYKTLTTKKEQRDSYRKHILNAVQKTLTRVDITDKASEIEQGQLAEDINVDVGDVPTDPQPGDEEKFIDIEGGPEAAEEEGDTFSIPGEDETGRNVAQSTFESVENQIVDAYSVLENAEDQKLFYDYLLTNLRLYFDKFESELDPNPDETGVKAEDAEISEPAEEPVPDEDEDELNLGLDDEEL